MRGLMVSSGLVAVREEAAGRWEGGLCSGLVVVSGRSAGVVPLPTDAIVGRVVRFGRVGVKRRSHLGGRRCELGGRSLDRLTPTRWRRTIGVRAPGVVTGGTSAATIGLLIYPHGRKEVPDEHGMWARFASWSDHVRRARGRFWGGVAGPVVAAGPATVPFLAARRGGPRAGDGPVAIAVEGCTGWRYVVEEVCAAGFEAHLAEPGDTQALRGRKRHAKTDRTDARLLRELLAAGDLPESWIPPGAVLEWRERCRLYKSLIDQRRVWVQRIHAELYQHGVTLPDGEIRAEDTREALSGGGVQITDAARERIAVGYRMIDATHHEAQALRDKINRFGRRQPGCRALVDALYGVGPLTAVVLWSELGDCARFSRSRQVVRHTGLDVTVDASDTHRGGGHLSRQGPPTLRWALFEAGMSRLGPPAPTGTTTRRSRPDTTASSPPSPWPESWPGAATTSCARSTPTRSTPSLRPDPRHDIGLRRPRPPNYNIRVSAVSSRHVPARQHSCWTAL